MKGSKGEIKMSTTLVDVVDVTAVSRQTVIVNVQPLSTSTIFDRNGGAIAIAPRAKITVEQSRVDLQQLRNLQNLNVISYEQYRKLVTAGSSGGTGSTG